MREERRGAGLLVRGALAALAILAATEAGAQVRRCSQDPVLTGRICSEAECILLSDAVHAPDACGGTASCETMAGCTALRAMRQNWLNCYQRRIIVNARCWSNFDLDHQWQAAEAIRHVGVCDARIRLPQPTGCADPCP